MAAIRSALALAVLLSGARPTAAADRFIGPAGGSGGAPYQIRCTAGNAVVIGFDARAGSWIDHIGPICSNGGVTQPVSVGGNGGAPQTARCPARGMVRSIKVAMLRSDNQLADEVKFECVAIADRNNAVGEGAITSPANENHHPGGFWAHFYGEVSLDCGDQIVVGIQGRAGDSVDSLGLICGDRR